MRFSIAASRAIGLLWIGHSLAAVVVFWTGEATSQPASSNNESAEIRVACFILLRLSAMADGQGFPIAAEAAHGQAEPPGQKR
jgi:hypothetical protein